jgi:hydrogenase maturation protease
VKYRIIGYGAPDRGDDLAGLLVVRRLREWGIEAWEHTGDGVALLEQWQGQEAVILIDAVVTGGIPGTVAVWNGTEIPLRGDFMRSSTHQFGVGEALRLARVLHRLPDRILIYGIEGRLFDPGSAPCAEVVAATERVARHLAGF